MIITKLNGGLGNQLFQYAIGRHLAEKRQTTLKLDISNLKKDSLRSYDLGNFNIKENFADQNETNRLAKKGWRKIANNLLPYSRRSYIQEKKLYHFDKNIFKAKNNICLDGFWQNEKYFKNIEDIIRSEFTLKKGLSGQAEQLEKNILPANAISLHIRRGDYLNQKISKIFTACGLDYYCQAAEKIAAVEKNPVFFVFSDDIEWAKNNLKINFPIFFVSGKNMRACEELILMSKCRHNIIANSSFSWWGAWLNNNPGKIIIAPKNWINNLKYPADDLIPSSWIKI